MCKIYSQGYMKDDAVYHRITPGMSLLQGMLGLVMANNFCGVHVLGNGRLCSPTC